MADMSVFLAQDFLGTPVPLWLAFVAVVLGLLVFDLGVLHRKTKEIKARESFILYGCYMAIALAFGAWVTWAKGSQSGLEFYTGYLIEQSLAMDNIFIIALIFSSLRIPPIYQHRVLFWGVLGVIVFRAVLIGIGAALVMSFSWILYVFGAFLIFTGLRMLRGQEHGANLDDNAAIGFLRRHLRMTRELSGTRFLTWQADAVSGKRKLHATPLLLALILVEGADLVFAVDSVPAIFAITQDPFVVYTSNIFAVLGLRSLYFALAAAMHRFAYLQVSLAAILILVGAKIGLVPLGIKVDTVLSLAVTIAILAAGIGYSLWRTRHEPGDAVALEKDRRSPH
jgi:tellurite resistance protein TerC